MWRRIFTQTSLPTFLQGGVHPPDHKLYTQHLPIEHFPTPSSVTLPLIQHVGDPALTLVKRGDWVKPGDLIAQAQGAGVPVHASISGKVTKISSAPHPIWVNAPAITIESQSPSSEPSTDTPFPADPHWTHLSPTEMLDRIRQAGIVGLGGAAFPTYRKLTPPKGSSVDTLIINGAECEPYLTADHRLMLEESKKIILGAWAMAKILNVHHCIIGIETNKGDAAGKLLSTLSHHQPDKWSHPVTMSVRRVTTKYPQGSEKQLIQALLKRTVPHGKLPFHVGVIVQNVATVAACCDALETRKPLIERVITLSGKGIRMPKNIRVPLGTALSELVNFCGGLSPEATKIIHGGPMMGRALSSLDVPIIKGTSGILFLTPEETTPGPYGPCIQCGACLEACPLGLQPNRISLWVEAGRPLQTEKYGTRVCFECGCCAYVCPSRRPLVQFIQVSKAAYQHQQATLSIQEVTHA